MRKRGFTLIELLIVITLIGILAIVLLSAINPIEQMRKARDGGRKADAAELLNAMERFYTTYGCYAWDSGYTTQCSGGEEWVDLGANPRRIVQADMQVGGDLVALFDTDEMKIQFASRNSVVNSELTVYEDTTGTTNTVSICFIPESQSAQLGGLGVLKGADNTDTGICNDFDPVTALYTENCWVCVPQ